MCMCEYTQGHVCASVRACVCAYMHAVYACVCVCVCAYLCECVRICVLCVCVMCTMLLSMVLSLLLLHGACSSDSYMIVLYTLYELVLFCFFSRSWYKIVLQI